MYAICWCEKVHRVQLVDHHSRNDRVDRLRDVSAGYDCVHHVTGGTVNRIDGRGVWCQGYGRH